MTPPASACRVLVDLSVAPPGGAGTYAAGFAAGLAATVGDQGVAVVVLVDRRWADDRPELVDGLRAAGHTVDALDLDAPGSWRARVLRGSVLRRAVRRHAPHVALFPRDAAPRVPVPSVVLLQNLYAWRRFESSAAVGGPLAAAALRHVARRSARRASAVLAVSQAIADAAAPVVAVTAVVHHGCSTPEHVRRIDPDEAHPEPVAMVVANVIANKRIEVVVAGVARARAGGLPWALRVYGNVADPAYAARLEAEADELLGASVLCGPAYGEDLEAAYRRADVVVVGGTFESFCLPLVEAMRSGCVVVAPECELVRELCGDVAVTFAEGDPASLAAALDTAWAERADRATRGVEHARRFRWDRTVAVTLGHLRAACPVDHPSTVPIRAPEPG